MNESPPPASFANLARSIRWIISDVDGVMTDGSLLYDHQGNELKKFHVRDGLGIKLWKLSEGKFGILTARSSAAVQRRADELKVDFLSQGSENKWQQAERFFAEQNIDPAHVCYLGDDLTDLPVLEKVGLAACVADAAEEVLSVCHLITDRPGGYGAVREVIERLLNAQDRWHSVLQKYQQNTATT